MRSLNIKILKNNSFRGYLTVDIKGKQQLNNLIVRLEKIKDVINVGRIK
jgi:(p)ppGpp synthase/HD superfamily hydrolase